MDVAIIIFISETAAENMESQESQKKSLTAHHIEIEEISSCSRTQSLNNCYTLLGKEKIKLK